MLYAFKSAVPVADHVGTQPVPGVRIIAPSIFSIELTMPTEACAVFVLENADAPKVVKATPPVKVLPAADAIQRATDGADGPIRLEYATPVEVAKLGTPSIILWNKGPAPGVPEITPIPNLNSSRFLPLPTGFHKANWVDAAAAAATILPAATPVVVAASVRVKMVFLDAASAK
jgi:hypothetical protein